MNAKTLIKIIFHFNVVILPEPQQSLKNVLICQSCSVQNLLPESNSQVILHAFDTAANENVNAYSPAGVNNSILKYNTSFNVRIYQTATSPMDCKFDWKSNGLLKFLKQVCNTPTSQTGKTLLATDTVGVAETFWQNLSNKQMQILAHSLRYMLVRVVIWDQNNYPLLVSLTHSQRRVRYDQSPRQ